MTRESWQFRTTKGVVKVDHDAVHIQSTLRQFLAAQRLRLHAGGRREVLRSVWVLVGAVFIIGYLGYETSRALDVGVAGLGLFSVVSVVVTVLGVWESYLRTKTIPLSALERVTIDESNRELTIRYDDETVHTLPSWLYDWNPGTKTLTLPGDEAVRDAHETLRLRGISVEKAEKSANTVRRFIVRNGVYFCESCDGQVSPTDSTCPSCGYALRVEAGSDATAEQNVAA